MKDTFADVYVCDFNDSFTYNIYSELKLIKSDLSITVIPFVEIEKTLIKLENSSKRVAIVLGPGPGKPSDYDFLYRYLNNIEKNPNIFLMGICLGHQIYWAAKGFSIGKSLSPAHGHSQTYNLPMILKEHFDDLGEIEVQRYNSLQVYFNQDKYDSLKLEGEVIVDDKELVLYIDDNKATYQFHPESIGTKKSRVFFNAIFDHIS